MESGADVAFLPFSGTGLFLSVLNFCSRKSLDHSPVVTIKLESTSKSIHEFVSHLK